MQSAMCFLLTSIVCLLIPISYELDLEEKNWLDRCDLIRMKQEGYLTDKPPTIPTEEPIYPHSSYGTSQPEVAQLENLWWWQKHKEFGLRPLATKEQIFETLKQKLRVDEQARGIPKVNYPWMNAARGFLDDIYDYDDY